MQCFTIETAESDCWMKILQQCGVYDIYHLPEYHQLVENDKTRAVLFVLQAGAATVAMPLLLRRIEGLPGIEDSAYQDVTSVYGYPGPISNLQQPSGEVQRFFAMALHNYFDREKVVAAFSRLHPIFDQAAYLSNLDGRVLAVGPTVTIDLKLPVAVQCQQYRGSHRREIERAKREGVDCIHDQEWQYLDAFIEIYYQTMDRHRATDDYYFSHNYFTRLCALLKGKLHLFVARKDGVVISGALFTRCNSIIQYHLAGTDGRYRKLAPSKLILDTVRQWGVTTGAAILHLGGGLGSREDDLFRFKAGFSNLRCQFSVWQMVVNPRIYSHFVEQKRAWRQRNGLNPMDADYFPAYRGAANLKAAGAPVTNPNTT